MKRLFHPKGVKKDEGVKTLRTPTSKPAAVLRRAKGGFELCKFGDAVSINRLR